jgi:predicted aspartyl protease
MNNLSLPYVELRLSNPKTGESILTKALVDTGASMTCIPKALAENLRLEISGQRMVSTVGGPFLCTDYVVDIKVRDRQFRGRKVLAMPEGFEIPLLGWDVLKDVWIEPLRSFVEGRTLAEVINILDFVPSFKQKHVLVLGQDTTEIQRLRAIQQRLKFHGYDGIVVKDIADIEIQSVEEKVNMLASLCAFVVCENSTPSGHIDELKICSLNRFVTAVLQEEGRGATWMQADYAVDYTFIETFRYPNLEEISSVVDKAVEWSRKKIEERKVIFNRLYRWRGTQQV